MAKKTTSLTSAEKRKLDNIVNKINKRLIRMVRTGMFSSKAYNEITNQLVTLGGKLIQQKLQSLGYSQAPASGIGGLFNHPIKWETVYDPEGAPVRVPQLSRAAWVLEGSRSSLAAMDAIGTGLAERVAAEDYYRAVYDAEPTDRDIQNILDNEAAKSDMLSYVWDYLYGVANVQEVQDFFSSIPEHYKDKAEQEAFSQKAIELYSKYNKQVDKSQVAHPALSKASRNDLFGFYDKISQSYVKGKAEKAYEAVMAALQSDDDVDLTLKVRDWLSLDYAVEGYGGSGWTPYQPTGAEVAEQVKLLRSGVIAELWVPGRNKLDKKGKN